jgi:hypothetical protein
VDDPHSSSAELPQDRLPEGWLDAALVATPPLATILGGILSFAAVPLRGALGTEVVIAGRLLAALGGAVGALALVWHEAHRQAEEQGRPLPPGDARHLVRTAALPLALGLCWTLGVATALAPGLERFAEWVRLLPSAALVAIVAGAAMGGARALTRQSSARWFALGLVAIAAVGWPLLGGSLLRGPIEPSERAAWELDGGVPELH